MSKTKRYLEELLYDLEYDELYDILEATGWSDEDIDRLYDMYRD